MNRAPFLAFLFPKRQVSMQFEKQLYSSAARLVMNQIFFKKKNSVTAAPFYTIFGLCNGDLF